MNLLFTAPIARPTVYGGGNISGVAFNQVMIDPDGLTASAFFWVIEDGMQPGRGSQRVQVPITGNETMAQLLAAFKAVIATSLNTTFQ